MNPSPGSGHRGAGFDPPIRFGSLHRAVDPLAEPDPDEDPAPLERTQFIADHGRTILNRNDSPDIGFTWSLNPYRGCEHGCIYCYARPTHEYLGWSAGLDFESRILVKHDAPEHLRRELGTASWIPDTIALSGVTDCYQPVERRLRLTRRCLEVLAEFRNPVGIVTKNALVTRDVDVLSELARHRAVTVYVSLTTLDSGLRAILEPRTSPPAARLRAIRTLAQAGIPVGVMVAPVIPAVNDHEIPQLLAAAADAGATFAGKVVLRLPHAVAPLFEDWLGRHFPDRKEKVLGQLRALRGGRLNDPRFGSRMRGEGLFAEQIARLFEVGCRKAGLMSRGPDLSTASFRRVEPGQGELFDFGSSGTTGSALLGPDQKLNCMPPLTPKVDPKSKTAS
ncbi:MAG: PA0069 family radical SAM protein [Verrucomicrobiales bacterium]|nr:PA0069 family radical SAM protein [Verrucomicrobiales bacterium]